MQHTDWSTLFNVGPLGRYDVVLRIAWDCTWDLPSSMTFLWNQIHRQPSTIAPMFELPHLSPPGQQWSLQTTVNTVDHLTADCNTRTLAAVINLSLQAQKHYANPYAFIKSFLFLYLGSAVQECMAYWKNVQCLEFNMGGGGIALLYQLHS